MRYLLIILVLSSCSVMSEAYLSKKGVLPTICADRFPVKADTIIQKDTLVQIDTFLSGEYIFDTIKVNDTVINIQYKPLEILKTKTLIKKEVVVDNAKVKALEVSVSELQAQKAVLLAEVNEYKDKAKTRLNWLILLLCGIFGFAIRKPLMAIIKWNLRIS